MHERVSPSDAINVVCTLFAILCDQVTKMNDTIEDVLMFNVVESSNAVPSFKALLKPTSKKILSSHHLVNSIKFHTETLYVNTLGGSTDFSKDTQLLADLLYDFTRRAFQLPPDFANIVLGRSSTLRPASSFSPYEFLSSNTKYVCASVARCLQLFDDEDDDNSSFLDRFASFIKSLLTYRLVVLGHRKHAALTNELSRKQVTTYPSSPYLPPQHFRIVCVLHSHYSYQFNTTHIELNTFLILRNLPLILK